MADRVNLRPLVILAPALSAAMMSLLGVAPNYGIMALFLLITGLSSACLHSVAPVIAGNLSGRNLGRGMSFWMLGGELGRTLGPLVIVSAVDWLSLQGVPWLMIGGVAGSTVLYLRLKGISMVSPNAGERLPWRQALHNMGPVLLPLAGVVTVRAFMIVSLTTYLPILLRDRGADLWLAGAALTVLEGAGVAGALLGGSMSDRIGRRWVLSVSLLVTPLLMFLFLGAQGWLQFPLLLLLGFSSLSVTPVVMALMQESFPENRALANGMYMALNFVLRSVATLLVGLMGDRFGQSIAFAASAAIPLLGLPLTFLLPARRAEG
jgi:FSR family fosmidomycin resistance protein-like MFS transporter